MTGIHNRPDAHDDAHLSLAACVLLHLEEDLSEYWCPTIRRVATERILRLISNGVTDIAELIPATTRWLAWMGLIPRI